MSVKRIITIYKTKLTKGGELERRWLAYLQKADTNTAAAIRSLMKKACDEAGV